jgi:hypothetical protein
MPLPLTEAQASQVYRIARPLEDPAGFIADVTTTLATFAELGDGLVYRVCRDTRLAHWTPPELGKHSDCSKYR